MGEKPKNVLSNIMTKRHYLAFGHDVAQNVFLGVSTKVAFCLLVFI